MAETRPLMEFPTEVLDEVFSYLTLYDRKKASLVCQSWNEIAFSPRFLKSVRLCVARGWDQSVVNCFRKSNRCYRTVFVNRFTDPLDKLHFGFIIQILDIFGARLNCFHSWTKFTEDQMWNVFIRVPNIRELDVTVDAAFLNCDRSIPLSKRVRDTSSTNNVLPELLQLDTYSSTLSQYAISINATSTRKSSSVLNFFSVEDLRFPKLEVLKLWTRSSCGNDRALRLFFNSFQCLKDVNLDFIVSDRMLDALTQSCSAIESLHMNLRHLNSGTFQFLERLTKLETLSIFAYIDHQLTLKGKPLESVKRLCFYLKTTDDEIRIFKDFRQLLPNVDDISIHMETSGIIMNVCQNFPHLKRLTIFDVLTNRRHDSTFSQNFRNLDQLEELTVKSAYVTAECMPPIRHLKRLKLKLFLWLSDEELTTLANLYPNLKNLELLGSLQVTRNGVADFRSRLPNCAVHLVRHI